MNSKDKAPSPGQLPGLGGALFPVQTSVRWLPLHSLPSKAGQEERREGLLRNLPGAGAALDPPRWFCCSPHDLQSSPSVSFEAINLYLSWRFLITAKMSYLNLYFSERDHFTFRMKQRPLARGEQQIFQHTQHSWVWCFFLNLCC